MKTKTRKQKLAAMAEYCRVLEFYTSIVSEKLAICSCLDVLIPDIAAHGSAHVYATLLTDGYDDAIRQYLAAHHRPIGGFRALNNPYWRNNMPASTASYNTPENRRREKWCEDAVLTDTLRVLPDVLLRALRYASGVKTMRDLVTYPMQEVFAALSAPQWLLDMTKDTKYKLAVNTDGSLCNYTPLSVLRSPEMSDNEYDMLDAALSAAGITPYAVAKYACEKQPFHFR